MELPPALTIQYNGFSQTLMAKTLILLSKLTSSDNEIRVLAIHKQSVFSPDFVADGPNKFIIS